MRKDRLPSTMLGIEGVHASGRHGANPGEQLEAQEFIVDLEIWIRAGEDLLEDTVDYRDIVATAREVVRENSFVLLETLAEMVASSVLALGDISRVTAVVHKPGAASSLAVGDVLAEATVDE
jgi:dihydroneopterin aldolase